MRAEEFPSGDAYDLALGNADFGQHVGERRRSRRPGRASRRAGKARHRARPGRRRIALVPGPADHHRGLARREDEERLLEARLETGEISNVGKVLSVAIDDGDVDCRVERRVSGSGQAARCRSRAESSGRTSGTPNSGSFTSASLIAGNGPSLMSQLVARGVAVGRRLRHRQARGSRRYAPIPISARAATASMTPKPSARRRSTVAATSAALLGAILPSGR